MNKTLSLVLLFLSTATVMAQQAKATSLMSKDLTAIPGREVLMITVEYPPGGADPIHRHNAHAFVDDGGLNSDAGERWKGSDADTWPDLL